MNNFLIVLPDTKSNIFPNGRAFGTKEGYTTYWNIRDNNEMKSILNSDSSAMNFRALTGRSEFEIEKTANGCFAREIFFDGSEKVKTQHITLYPNNSLCKVMRVKKDNKEAVSISYSFPDGYYKVTRMNNNKIKGGYEVFPLNRKLFKGIQGTLEKLALYIGTDCNGCERPVLRCISGFIIRHLRK